MLPHGHILLHAGPSLNPGAPVDVEGHTLWGRQLGLRPAQEVGQYGSEMSSPSSITIGWNVCGRLSLTGFPLEGAAKLQGTALG